MAQSVPKSAEGRHNGSSYSPHEHRPLAAYAALMSVYGAGVAGGLLGLRARGRRLPEKWSVGDIVMIGAASHKMARQISKDKVTSWLRAPFVRFEAPAGHGEVEETVQGEGLHRAVGELLTCPYCLSHWVASGMGLGVIAAPRFTRLVAFVYTAETLADFLQLAYLAAEERASTD